MLDFNQQRKLLTSVLRDLMRGESGDSTAVRMGAYSARVEIKQVLKNIWTYPYLSLAQHEKLLASGISVDSVDLLLPDAYLRPFQVLTVDLLFDIDTAYDIIGELSAEELASLPKIVNKQLQQFRQLYSQLSKWEDRSFEKTVAKILTLLQQVDAELKPWHITKLFNSVRFAEHMVNLHRGKLLEEENIRGTDECARKVAELEQKINPQAVTQFIEVLKFTPELAHIWVTTFLEHEVRQVAPFIRWQFKSLLKEILLMVRTQKIPSFQAKNNIFDIINFKFSQADKFNETVVRLFSYNFNPFLISIALSPTMSNLLDSHQQTDIDINEIIARIYHTYDAKERARQQRQLICEPIIDCVTPHKLTFLSKARLYKILDEPNGKVATAVLAIEQSIAKDLINCGRAYYDYPLDFLQHDILRTHHPVQFNLSDGFSHYSELNFADGNSATEELTIKQKTYSVTHLFNGQYKEYQLAVDKCPGPQNEISVGRRLLALEGNAETITPPSIWNMLGNLVYQYVGEPLLQIIKDSPTYFPPQQPDLWNGSSSPASARLRFFYSENFTVSNAIAPPVGSTPRLGR